MNVVTGAFGYIGRYITRELLSRGQRVRTITTHPDKPNPFGPKVNAFPYHFENPEKLTAQLDGVEKLFNTYYIRFEHGGVTFDQAVANTQILFECARRAGVQKIVHIGVTNSDPDDELAYYRGKARQERALRNMDVDHTVLRPTLVYGVEDILVNNIAWLIRHFPIFPIFGSGEYRLQPVFVGDLAQIAVDVAGREGAEAFDVIGQETYTFKSFVRKIVDELSPATQMIHVPPRLGQAMGKPIGWLMGDVLLTWDELKGLMREKLTSEGAPQTETNFSDWLREHKDELGMAYTSELGRHFY
ncbi:MAG: SDR family oxidoreductase [Anaerolineales bacterium]